MSFFFSFFTKSEKGISSKLVQKLMKGQISKIGFSKGDKNNIFSFHVFTLSSKRMSYFFTKKQKRVFLSKLIKKLMKCPISKIRLLKGIFFIKSSLK